MEAAHGRNADDCAEETPKTAEKVPRTRLKWGIVVYGGDKWWMKERMKERR